MWYYPSYWLEKGGGVFVLLMERLSMAHTRTVFLPMAYFLDSIPMAYLATRLGRGRLAHRLHGLADTEGRVLPPHNHGRFARGDKVVVPARPFPMLATTSESYPGSHFLLRGNPKSRKPTNPTAARTVAGAPLSPTAEAVLVSLAIASDSLPRAPHLRLGGRSEQK